MRNRRALNDILYRIRDPRLIASHAFRAAAQAYDLFSPSEFSRTYRQVRQLTMCSNARLRGLHWAVKHVVSENIPGDIVECGTARGGSLALMGITLNRLEAGGRTLWGFDTFEGLPPPTLNDPDYELAKFHTGTCLGTLEEVSASFERLGILDRAKLIKGLFQDTLPVAPLEKIAVLHIDGDWYESVKTCLEQLYHKMANGGVIQIDDYGFWKGAGKAVDEFFADRSIKPELKRIDYSGRQYLVP